METIRKLSEKNRDINGKPAVTIAFLGDSVSHPSSENFKHTFPRRGAEHNKRRNKRRLCPGRS